MKYALAVAVLFTAAVQSYADSGIGSNGIDATGLKLPDGTDLTGAGIGIGQVEGSRPGKSATESGPDDATNSASTVVPAQVYMRTAIANVNGFRIFDISGNDHGQQVASVMVSTDNMAPGVAPGALLHASGYATTSTTQRDAALTANHVAGRNGGDIFAINMSFGMALDGFETTDGSSHLSSFVDWSAVRHDVLYVVAGREDIGGEGPVPSDNYNGVTVGGSTNLGVGDNVFNRVWSGNDFTTDALGDRVSVDLLAPATLIDVVQVGGAVNEIGLGTSFAAPHVTGAVALLQQHAKFQIDNSVPRWTDPNAQRHEVMKAILLNSADKLSGVHGSTRNVFTINGTLWGQTTAHSSANIPLDLGMGAGHLNVSNALTNFEPGEYGPGNVPLLGWDYGAVGGGIADYEFTETLAGDSWVALTLAWDRVVALTDPDNTYNSGDEFFNNTIEMELTNLDLYLMPASSNNLADAVASSTADADSVEHIFMKLGASQGGDYKIRVVNAGGGPGGGQEFGLAWWAGEVTTVPGDFDGDGDVDGDDLGQFESGFGLGNGGDADGDGDTDGADFLTWQRNFTGPGALAELTAVPEPGSWLLLVVGVLALPRSMGRSRPVAQR